MNKKLTIIDIAKMANVSRGTVSRVINGNGPVAPETERIVRKVIEENHYVPNASAKNLKSPSKFIGVVNNNMLNPYFSDVMNGIERTLRRNGYTMFYVNGGSDLKAEEKEIYDLLSCNVRGLILLSSLCNDKSESIVWAKKKVEIVAVETAMTSLDSVNTDNRAGLKQAIDYLNACGHQQIGFFGNTLETFSSQERFVGFQEGLAENHLPFDKSFLFLGKDYKIQWEKAAEEKRLPTALIALNDYHAYELMDLCHERKIRMPEDLSVVGFDDLQFSRLTHPKLTTVKIPVEEMGETAAELLLKRIEQGQKGSYQKIMIGTQLIVRGSVHNLRT